MTAFERGTRVTFTDRRESCADDTCAHTGQSGVTGAYDRHGVEVTFSDGFTTYAFNNEIEVTP